jgi:hypothetical protein
MYSLAITFRAFSPPTRGTTYLTSARFDKVHDEVPDIMWLTPLIKYPAETRTLTLTNQSEESKKSGCYFEC